MKHLKCFLKFVGFFPLLALSFVATIVQEGLILGAILPLMMSGCVNGEQLDQLCEPVLVRIFDWYQEL